MVDFIKIRPGSVRGLGNVLTSKSISNYNVHHGILNSSTESVDSLQREVFTLRNDDGIVVGDIVLAASSNSIYESQSVTFNATVRDENSVLLEGLSVVFYNGNDVIGTSTTNNDGVASLTYTPSGIGFLNIHAVCKEENSNTVNVTVNGVTADRLILSSNASLAYIGSYVQLNATLLSNIDTRLANSTITFKQNSSIIGTANTNEDGVAVYNYFVQNAGNYSLTATYGGITSDPVNLKVKTNNNPATVSVSVSPGTTVTVGTNVFATVTVRDVDGDPNDGVQIYGSIDGGSTYSYLGTTNNNGQITTQSISSNTPTSWSYKFRVGANGITSNTIPVTVTAGSVSSITCSSNHDVIIKNNPLTLSSIVTYASGTFEGTVVEFYNGSTLLGTGTTNSSGVATCRYTPTTVGYLSVTAKVGNSTSTSASVRVKNDNNPATFNVNVSPSSNVSVGTGVTATVRVTDSEGDICSGVQIYESIDNGSTYSYLGTTNSNGQISTSERSSNVPSSWDWKFRVGTNGITSSTTHITVTDASVSSITVNATPINLGESTDITATLLNSNGAGVSGKTVNFYAKAPGGSDTLIGTGTTNSSGVATLNNYTPNTYGIWEFYAKYGELTSTRTSIRVKQILDHIVLTATQNPSWNVNQSWSATLYDSNNNVIIDSRTVELYIENMLYDTVTSHENTGVANGTYCIVPETYSQSGITTWQTTMKAVSGNVNSNTVTLEVQSTGLIEFSTGNLGQFNINNGVLEVSFTDDREYCSYSLEDGYLVVTTDLPESSFRISNGVLYCTPP